MVLDGSIISVTIKLEQREYMKLICTTIFLFAAFTNYAANNAASVANNPLNGNWSGAALEQQREAYAIQEAKQEAQAQYDAAVATELNKIYSKDPWRKIGDTTNLARGSGWVEFQGKVEEARPNGAVFRGKWGAVMTIFTDSSENPHLITTTDSNASSQRGHGTAVFGSSRVEDTSIQHKILYGDDLFFVENFPYPSSTGAGYEKMMALDSDYYPIQIRQDNW